MASNPQYPGGGRGGRGPHPGGRGGGGYYPQQQQQQQQPGRGGGVGGMPPHQRMGAWQPVPPTSLQQAAGYPPHMPPQQQQQLPPGQRGPPQYHPGMQAPPYFNPYMQGGAGYRQPGWQPAYPQQGMRGGVFYPPTPDAASNNNTNNNGSAAVTPSPPVLQPPRPKKALVITDKEGNVIDLGAPKKPVSSALQQAAAAATAPATTPTTTTEAATTAAATPATTTEAVPSDADSKLEQAVLEKLRIEDDKTETPVEADPQEETPTEESPKKSSSLAAMLATQKADTVTDSGRRVYSKDQLLEFKANDNCQERPSDLPDMTIVKGPPRRNSQSNRQRSEGGGGGGGGNWERGQNRRQSGNNNVSGGSQWERGQAPPKNQRRNSQRHNKNNNGPPFFDGPVAPLVKSENHWRPIKNTSALVIAEKKVKSILNKMTKEKFARLSQQMLEIPILTYETLNMMIDNVYDKAIDEPSFGDIYSDLCVLLSQSVQVSKLVHIIESDEQPPTEDGETAAPDAEGTHHTVYRWSNDVSANDSEVVGPLPSEDACYDVALDEEEHEPGSRGDMELELVQVCIRRGIFIKIMKKKDAKEDEEDVFYTVYFPVGEAKELGQQMSDLFLSQIECESDASKKNSFKRSLLNKCEVEFNKQDIYSDWKAEKKAYEESKSSLTDAERAEKEEELDFRRIHIKKQMLGNVKFIGQLYKKKLLKEKILRFCISSLLKLEELPKEESQGKNPEYKDTGETDMDEEDHEAICNMFTTMGSTIDTPAAARFMDVCFSKIKNLSVNKDVPTRSRFLYKDLIDLRDNRWIPRRKEEKAKTLDEIRKDVEKEERRQAQISQQNNRGGRDYGGRGVGQRQSFSNRPRQPKPVTQTDEDGFTTVTTGAKPASMRQPKRGQERANPAPASSLQTFAALAEEAPAASSSSKPAPLSEEKLERRVKSMRSDFMADGGNVDELLLTMEEISGTPDAGLKLVSKSADRIMDCKEDERQAIYSIISTLVEKGKITSSDVRGGLMDAIEFIDSMVMDSPRAYEYLGTLLGKMLKLKAVDVAWLCEQCEKTKVDPNTKAPEKLVKISFATFKNSGGDVSAVADESLLSSLLGDDSWKAIAPEVM